MIKIREFMYDVIALLHSDALWTIFILIRKLWLYKVKPLYVRFVYVP